MQEAVNGALKDNIVVQFVDAKTKKEANVVLRSSEDAKKAEAVLTEHFVNKNLRIMIV